MNRRDFLRSLVFGAAAAAMADADPEQWDWFAKGVMRMPIEPSDVEG